MKRKIISLMLAVCILVGLVPVWQVEASAANYNASAALAYASAHWDDGVGLCAEFVSNCIKAGGSSCYSSSGSTLYNQLVNSGTGTAYDLALVKTSGGVSVKASNYSDRLSPGDVVWFYCSGCSDGKPYVHTVLCNGMDDNGYMKAYSHNNKNNGSNRYYYGTTCPYCGGTISKAVVFHFNGNNGGSATTYSPGIYSIATVSDPLNIRSGAGSGYSKVGEIPKGTNVTIYETSGTWGKVTYNGTEGWISLTLCTIVTKFVDIGSFYGYIIQSTGWKHLENSNHNVQIAANGNDSNDPKQIWHFERQSDGLSYKITNMYDNTVLDLHNSGTSDGTNVETYTSNGGKNQLWYICYTGNACSIISKCGNNLALDCNGGSTAAKTNVQIWTRNGTNAQLFSIYDMKNDGKTYSKPAKPAKPVVTIPSAVEKNSDFMLSWSNCPEKNTFDSRSYTVKMWNSSGKLLYTQTGFTNLSQKFRFVDTGVFQFQVIAVNNRYPDYETASDKVKITVTNEKAEYTITYNANGGSGAPAAQKAKEGESTKLSSTIPTRSGYQFIGWSKSNSSSTADYQAGGSITVTSNITLYAVWQHTHSYNSGVITTAPTCTKTGVKTYTCTICKSTKTETIAATGHNYELKNAVSATCTASGYTGDQICKNCGNVKSKGTTISATGHSWGNWVVTKNATETDQGVETRTCSVCKAQENRSIPTLAHTHKYQFSQTIAPTCTTAGYDLYCCSCGAEEKRNQKSATGHSYELRNAVAATCTTSGYTGDEICKNCGNIKSKGTTISATGHSWGEWIVVTPATYLHSGTQTRTCSICGASETQEVSPLSSPFVDVQDPNSYCYDAVLWAVENGITNGYDETHFAPDRSCTRAQIVTFLWRAAGSPEPFSNNNPFTDVKDGPYYKAILWAVENGITKGTTATTFEPNAACTRAQIVTFIYRAAGEPQIQNSTNPFTDVKGGAYYKAILWAVENGITKGTTATTFAPNATCTRGQGVTFLYRGRDLLK